MKKTSALLFLLLACGGDDPDPSDLGATITDTGDTSDAVEPTDIVDDTESNADVAEVDTDAASDAGAGDVGNACTPGDDPPLDPLNSEQTRFALTMFHFNIEYVIGGLEYFDEEGEAVQFLGLPINAGWDNDRVEDFIIDQTLRPILEMYDQHPEWRVTIELQAYAIEVMAARHEQTLELMREMAQRGQVELVSWHYAAQLFLAFPAEDQRRSLARTREVFDEHCLPLSGVVFNQEGQAGEGRQRMLVEEGWEIGVQPENLWRYVRDGETPWPYYESEGGTLIVGPGGVDQDSGIEVTWPFFDDGELRAVAGAGNPYTAAITPYDPARVAEYEAQLEALETDGWKHTTISDYVRQLEGMGVERPSAPPLLDGTWQPPSTDSIHRWLGGRSQANVGDEEDNRVRSGNADARMHADATQVLLEVAVAAELDGDDWQDQMDQIWEDLWHAQVSDASGVNPWRAEVLWCLRLNDEVVAGSAELRTELLAALEWEHVMVDLMARTAEEIQGVPMPDVPSSTEPWFEVQLRADGRETQVEWLEAGAENRARVQITFSAAEPCEGCDRARIEAAFPFSGSTISYSPGLIEDEVRSYQFDDFSWLMDEVYLPLPNGLIGLGEDLWLIKHVRETHIAARLSPSDGSARFIDAAIYPTTQELWVFDVFVGTDDEALAAASRLNIDPVVFY